MRKVKFLVTVMGIPHIGGTEITVQANKVGVITDEAYEILRWKRTFDNNPWIVDIGVRQDSPSARRRAGDFDLVSRINGNGNRDLGAASEREPFVGSALRVD